MFIYNISITAIMALFLLYNLGKLVLLYISSSRDNTNMAYCLVAHWVLSQLSFALFHHFYFEM